MNKDFNVKNFVEEYESRIGDVEKAQFLKTKLKCENYIPYAEKVLIAENIIQSSSYAVIKEGNELKKTDKIQLNSPMRYILFVMSIVNKYTNIEVNFKSIMPEFDYLNKNGLIEIICNKVGDREVGEFNTVVEMVLDDFVSNKFEIKNYISDALLKVENMMAKYAPLINNIANKIDNMSEEDADKLTNLFGKAVKFIK